MNKHAVLLVTCRDRTGIVAGLTDFVFRHGGNIISLDQHSEEETGDFFMRLEWDLAAFKLDRAGIEAGLTAMAQSMDIAYQLHETSRPQRIAVFCSKTPHCLYDLLLRQQMGELVGGEIAVVISNHPDLSEVTGHFGIPFHHIPVSASTKEAAEQQQEAVLADHGVDLVVLARYMQILSQDFSGRWHGKAINIHHSFLPAFAGAKPYHQAKARGVKIIGATAHYVTADLDEGPIIEQDVSRVTHRDTVTDLVRKGRDLERQVLARAVRLHLDRRVVISGNRTVILS